MNVFTKILCSIFLFLSPGWLITSSFAQCDETELNSFDGATDDNFGAAIALDGGHLVVGASGDDTTAGSVYLFKKAGLVPFTFAIDESLVFASFRATADWAMSTPSPAYFTNRFPSPSWPVGESP